MQGQESESVVGSMRPPRHDSSWGLECHVGFASVRVASASSATPYQWSRRLVAGEYQCRPKHSHQRPFPDHPPHYDTTSCTTVNFLEMQPKIDGGINKRNSPQIRADTTTF